MQRLLLAAFGASAASHQAQPPPSLRAAAAEPVVLSPVPVVLVPVPVEAPVPVPVFIEGDGLSSECEKEMAAKLQDRKIMAIAEACEQKEDWVKTAIAKLQTGDVKSAESAVEATFSKCAKPGEKCAKQVAPSAVMKLRLSGMAVEQKCVKVAKEKVQTTKRDAKWEACQKSTAKDVAASLQKQDLNGAMMAAQDGLGTCYDVKVPCDFQLAPMLVMQLVQASAEAQQRKPKLEPELPPIPIFAAGADAAVRASKELAAKSP